MAAGSGAGTPVDRPHPGSDPGRGRRLGIDVGSVRIGVAASDPDGVLATPVETVPRAGSPGRRSGRTSGGSTARGAGGKVAAGADIARIAAIAAENEAVEIIVGLPRTLRGDSGTAARLAVEFAGKLRDSLPEVPIRLSDERLTTVSAARALRDSGVRARGQRQVIDQAAAVSILQSWLDERSSMMRSAEDAERTALFGDDE